MLSLFWLGQGFGQVCAYAYNVERTTNCLLYFLTYATGVRTMEYDKTNSQTNCICLFDTYGQCLLGKKAARYNHWFHFLIFKERIKNFHWIVGRSFQIRSASKGIQFFFWGKFLCWTNEREGEREWGGREGYNIFLFIHRVNHLLQST